MSRARRFVFNTAMGYALVASNIAFTVISVPLALRYLDKAEFGLWALAQQIAGYLMLIELGLPTAVSRLLADHKDRVNGGEYGSLLRTGAMVFVLQGVLLAVLGAAIALAAPAAFKIPSELAGSFCTVLLILAAFQGVSVALRAVSAPLWAFHRLDVAYGIGIITLAGNLASLWAGFELGWGIYSFAVAGIPSMIVCTLLGFVVCLRSGFYPGRGGWGAPSWQVFKQMFHFGKDVTLLSLGSQLVNASQVMILSRVAGLEAAATFAIGTKFFALGSQLTGRLIEVSAPTLTEMFVQKDSARLQRRFRDIFDTSLCLATIGAVALVLANDRMIAWWTSGVVTWSGQWDVLLGALLLATTFSRNFIGLAGIAGNLRPVRNIYLAEAAVFIAAGVPAARHFGIPGLLAASLAAHLLVTVGLSAVSARRVLPHIGAMLGPISKAAAILAAASAVTLATHPGAGGNAAGLATALVVVLVFSGVAAVIMLPAEVKDRVTAKVREILRGRHG